MNKNRKVAVINRGKERSFFLEHGSIPKAGKGYELIKVLFSGVARGDLARAGGDIPAAPGRLFYPGYDICGETAGSGEKVLAFPGSGGWAEYCLAPQNRMIPVPAGLQPETAIMLGLNYLSAYQMLHRIAGLKAGQTVLVYGAGGGLGTAVLDLCRDAGFGAYGAAGPDKKKTVESFGAVYLDSRKDIRAQLADGTKRFDLVLDPLSDRHRAQSMGMLASGGMVIAYGFLEKKANPLLFLTAGIRFRAGFPGRKYFFYSFEAGRNIRHMQQDMNAVFALALEKRISPLQYSMHSLWRYEDALRDLEDRSHTGKILLKIV